MIQSRKIDKYVKKSYPIQLLRLMKRQAEDLLLGDATNEQGKAALTFIKNVLIDRSGAEADILKKGIFTVYHINLTEV